MCKKTIKSERREDRFFRADNVSSIHNNLPPVGKCSTVCKQRINIFNSWKLLLSTPSNNKPRQILFPPTKGDSRRTAYTVNARGIRGNVVRIWFHCICRPSPWTVRSKRREVFPLRSLTVPRYTNYLHSTSNARNKTIPLQTMRNKIIQVILLLHLWYSRGAAGNHGTSIHPDNNMFGDDMVIRSVYHCVHINYCQR